MNDTALLRAARAMVYADETGVEADFEEARAELIRAALAGSGGREGEAYAAGRLAGFEEGIEAALDARDDARKALAALDRMEPER